MFLSIFGGILGLCIPVLLVAGAIYFIARSRGNRHEGVTIYDALSAYFYGIFGACLITAVVGVVLFIDVALKESSDAQGEQVSLAAVLVATGVAMGAMHGLGRVLVHRMAGRAFAGARRVYLFSMLGIFSLAGLVSVPLSIYTVVDYKMVEHPSWSHASFPSTEVAVAIVVVPLWCWYVFRVIRETVAGKNARVSPVMPEAGLSRPD